MRYIHNYDNWWQFRYDSHKVLNELGHARAKQGLVLGRMLSLGFDSQDEAVLTNMSVELVRSAEIEGEKLNFDEVRSSIARRLGIATAGIVTASRYVVGVVEMQLDATQHYDSPLSSERLFGWHNVLFPTGISGLYHIDVGKYRSGDMQVVSGPMGKEKVHYQAPSADRVPVEMERFISWINCDEKTDAVLSEFQSSTLYSVLSTVGKHQISTFTKNTENLFVNAKLSMHQILSFIQETENNYRNLDSFLATHIGMTTSSLANEVIGRMESLDDISPTYDLPNELSTLDYEATFQEVSIPLVVESNSSTTEDVSDEIV